MKKMILALVIAMVAFSAQAAALTWSAYAYDAAGNNLNTGCAYLIQVSDKANFSVSADLKTINEGEIVDSCAIIGGDIYGDWQDTGALADKTEYWFAILVTTDGVVGTAGEFTLPTTGTYVVDSFYSVTWNDDTGAGFDSVTMDETTIIKADQTVGGTTPPEDDPTIPEPTVLALLALGAAGLALKRKVA